MQVLRHAVSGSNLILGVLFAFSYPPSLCRSLLLCGHLADESPGGVVTVYICNVITCSFMIISLNQFISVCASPGTERTHGVRS